MVHKSERQVTVSPLPPHIAEALRQQRHTLGRHDEGANRPERVAVERIGKASAAQPAPKGAVASAEQENPRLGLHASGQRGALARLLASQALPPAVRLLNGVQVLVRVESCAVDLVEDIALDDVAGQDRAGDVVNAFVAVETFAVVIAARAATRPAWGLIALGVEAIRLRVVLQEARFPSIPLRMPVAVGNPHEGRQDAASERRRFALRYQVHHRKRPPLLHAEKPGQKPDAL